MLEAKFHEDWMSSDKRLKNIEKVGQELDELDKVQGAMPGDHIDNSSTGNEAPNTTAPSISE